MYGQLVSYGNLYEASGKALTGSGHSREALEFFFNLEHELLALQDELKGHRYKPAGYQRFSIHDIA